MLRTTLLALVIALVSPVAGGSPKVVAPMPARLAIEGATPSQEREIQWAVDRFAAAGFAMPALAIVVEPEGGCGGIQGRFMGGGDPARIELCDMSRAIVLHELGHVWIESTVTEATRQAFVAFLDLPSWSSRDVPWGRRGAEQAAIVMSVGLAEDPLDEYAASLQTRTLTAFEVLTGRPSPRLVSDR